jgi:ABC-type Fe3+ transport system permease subunit
MSLTNDVIAAGTLALVCPSVLFVVALFLRQVPPPTAEPARTADRIVRWYASHPQLALWVLMLLLPMAAFVVGSATLMRTWGENPQLKYWTWRVFTETLEHWPAVSVGVLTAVSAGLLMMVTTHLFRHPQQRAGA